jgi:NADPH:quinone reductase-like Zn-dependent oxidoreductase
MKAFEIREFGVDNLQIVDRETPRPGMKEVLVRLTAASLNYRDLLMVIGQYNPKLKRPLIPLSDGAGVVEEVGAGVTRFKAGDRVTPCYMQTWMDGPLTFEKAKSALGGAIDGVLAEYAVFQEAGLVPTPPSLSDEEAATLPCAAVTAWHALFAAVPSQPGETVLIQGTGGVSLFALQFAKVAGLQILLTSGSDGKIERARSLGAHETVNYNTTPKWDEAARQLTDNIGVDRVIEVGGSATLPRTLRALRTNGVASVIGVLGGGESTLSPVPILMNGLRLHGIYVGSRSMFESMNRAIALHRLKPVIDKTFHWTEVRHALHYMESQQHFGKICLKF